MSKPRKRRNAPAGSLPVGKFIPVEAIRCNADGTVNVVIRDEHIPSAVNRKRNATHRPRKKKTRNPLLGYRKKAKKSAKRRATAKKNARRKR